MDEYGADQTQITRALAELGIERISAHSPQAKGRIERFFHTAQDRLVKELRLAGVCSLEAANAWLDSEFLPNWQNRFAVPAANRTDAHRPLTEMHNLAASLSHVEERRIANDYTIHFRNQRYQIARSSAVIGMKGLKLRVEARLDDTLAVRFQGSYLDIFPCPAQTQVIPTIALSDHPIRKDHNRGGRSRWMQDYPAITPAPLWRALRDSNRKG